MSNLTIEGASWTDSLSDWELDTALDALGVHHTPARLFHDAARGATASVQPAIQRALKAAGGRPVVVPVHVTHGHNNHWVTGVVDGDHQRMQVWDSAPSEVSAAVIGRICEAAGVKAVVRSHAKQPRGSAECGLNVLFVALCVRAGAGLVPTTRVLSLAAWRTLGLQGFIERYGVPSEQQEEQTKTGTRQQKVGPTVWRNNAVPTGLSNKNNNTNKTTQVQGNQFEVLGGAQRAATGPRAETSPTNVSLTQRQPAVTVNRILKRDGAPLQNPASTSAPKGIRPWAKANDATIKQLEDVWANSGATASLPHDGGASSAANCSRTRNGFSIAGSPVACRWAAGRRRAWLRGAGTEVSGGADQALRDLEELCSQLEAGALGDVECDAPTTHREELVAWLQRRICARRAMLSCEEGAAVDLTAMDICCEQTIARAAQIGVTLRRAVVISGSGARLGWDLVKPGPGLTVVPVLLLRDGNPVGHWAIFVRNENAQKSMWEVLSVPHELLAGLPQRIGADEVILRELPNTGPADCGLACMSALAVVVASAQPPWTRETTAAAVRAAAVRLEGQFMAHVAMQQAPFYERPFPRLRTKRELDEVGDGRVMVCWRDDERGLPLVWFGELRTSVDGTGASVRSITYTAQLVGARVASFFDDSGKRIEYEPLAYPHPHGRYFEVCRPVFLPVVGARWPGSAATWTDAERTSMEQIVAAVNRLADEDDHVFIDALPGEVPWASDFSLGDALATPLAKLPLSAIASLQEDVPGGKPAYISAVTWKNLAESTRATHVKLLGELRDFCNTHPAAAEQPAYLAVIESLRLRNDVKRWAPQTLFKTAVQTAAALRALPLYRSTSQTVELSRSPVWRQFIAGLGKRVKEAQMRNPPATMSPEQYEQVISNIASPAAKAMFAVIWRTAARFGDVRQARPNELCSTEAEKHGWSLTIKRGKSAKVRGPYTVHFSTTAAEALLISDHISSRATREREDMWTAAEVKEIAAAMRAVSCTQRSTRRGSLQALAAILSDEELLGYSGHTNIATLRRYLAWGLVSTRSTRSGRERQAAALQSSSDDSDND